MSPLLKIFRIFTAFLILLILWSCSENDSQGNYGLVVHGGAGSINKETMPEEIALKYKTKLSEAVNHGYDMLENGAAAVDVVVEVINILEDSPLFNAGRGAVFTSEGTNELDASIMNGADLNAGAVGGVRHIKNPISLAREVMVNSDHVFLTGAGAEKFASEQGFEFVDSSYFYTDRSWNSYLKVKAEAENKTEKKYGTVGCCVLDKSGNLAAGTSTGGMTYKKYGRIGDSPLIGAGTYANNKTCAVSCTGHGEYYIRSVFAYDISAMMEYSGKSVIEAVNIEINRKLSSMGGSGGVIAIDTRGNIAMDFNTPGMFRAYRRNGKPGVVKLFAGE